MTLESTPCLLCGSSRSTFVLESEVQLAPATGETFRFVRCDECGLVYLNPRVTPSELGRYYPPSYLPHRSPEAWGPGAALVRGSERRLDRARARMVVRHAAGTGAEAILDLGCGRPTFLREIHRRTGMRCVGVDISDAGWRDEPSEWEPLTLIEGELERTLDRVRDAGPYDVITLWHALEHDYDPVETLRLLRDLAAPGALLLVEVPNLDSLTARRGGAGWAGLHTPRHTAAYDPTTLAATVSAGGWEVERVLPYGTLDPTVLWWLGRRIRRGDDLSGDLGRRLPGFVALKVVLAPLVALKRQISLGVQIAVAHAT